MSQNVRKTDLFLLRCLTNTHVGSGDTTYGVVDKIVQRDTISELPVIHSSGLKGAFRELLAYKKNSSNPNEGHKHPSIVSIFGSVKDSDEISSESGGDQEKEKEKKKNKELTAGSHIFYEAHLLSLPVRNNVLPFFRATSRERLLEMLGKVGLLISAEKRKELEAQFQPLLDQSVQEGRPLVFNADTDATIYLENWKWEACKINLPDIKKAEYILGDSLALFNEYDFKSLCWELPVIARNRLDNGISKNLWYEEVVPRESLFYSFLSYPDDDGSFNLWTELDGDCLIQVGGNATIGYGLCEITKI